MTRQIAFPSGLRFRLVTLVIAALAPFVILIGFVARQHRANERAYTENAAVAVAANVAQQLEDRIGAMELALLALRRAVEVSPVKIAQNDIVLRGFNADSPPQFEHFAVIAPNGMNIGTSDSFPNGARRAIDFHADQEIESKSAFRLFRQKRLYGKDGPEAIALVYELDDRGTRLIGLLALARLHDEVLARELPAGSVAAVVDESGGIVTSSPDSGFWAGLNPRAAQFSPPDSATGVGLLGGPGGGALYSAYAEVELAPFRVYVGTPVSLAFASARRDFLLAIEWGLLAFLLGVGLAWTQATRIIKPLEQLAADADVLGRGELGHRSRVDSTDELGQLARSINAMAETIELREAEAIQAQKMESVGQLAGGIAHDFNNLLTVISGRLELLAASEGLKPDEEEDIAEIRAATTRATSLTRQLLAFSRKQLLRPKVVDLNTVVDGLEPMLRRLIGEDVQIILQRDSGIGSVLADPGQLHQVLLNLSLNARDAMPTGGLLRIETNAVHVTAEMTAAAPSVQPGDYAVVSVTDTGHGMDERAKARIFDPFFTTKAAGKGTGLGLSTVYGIVKQSGAVITVDSAPGRGATFRVYFPVAETEATGEYPVIAHESADGTERVLIVEDERAVRDLAVRILEARGYNVISAAHSGDALQIIEGSNRPIDLVITDVVMPGMNGRELVEALRKARPGIKVLYMSGYTDDEIVRRGLLDPSVDFIQKPFTAQDLAVQTRRALDG